MPQKLKVEYCFSFGLNRECVSSVMAQRHHTPYKSEMGRVLVGERLMSLKYNKIRLLTVGVGEWRIL